MFCGQGNSFSSKGTVLSQVLPAKTGQWKIALEFLINSKWKY